MPDDVPDDVPDDERLVRPNRMITRDTPREFDVIISLAPEGSPRPRGACRTTSENGEEPPLARPQGW